MRTLGLPDKTQPTRRLLNKGLLGRGASSALWRVVEVRPWGRHEGHPAVIEGGTGGWSLARVSRG